MLISDIETLAKDDRSFYEAEIINPSQVANALGCSVNWVHELIDQLKMKVYRTDAGARKLTLAQFYKLEKYWDSTNRHSAARRHKISESVTRSKHR